MLYIQRDAEQNVQAIFLTPQPDASEVAALDSADVREFLARGEQSNRESFLSSDLDLIRVIEDLIQILLQKNLVAITDFPPSVVIKLINRQVIREQIQGVSGMDLN
jgi:hypothetical protein